MDNNILVHHGVKGQKWGVRRYQNKDGSLTPAGKKQQEYRRRYTQANKTSKEVDDIIKTMTKDEKRKLALDENDQYLTKEQGGQVAKRVIKRVNKTPVAWFDMLEDGSDIQLALGTRSGNTFRNKGYAQQCVKRGMEWFKHQEEYDTAIWGVRVDNTGSIKIAEKNGFKKDDTSYSDDKQWVNYVYKKDRR